MTIDHPLARRTSYVCDKHQHYDPTCKACYWVMVIPRVGEPVAVVPAYEPPSTLVERLRHLAATTPSYHGATLIEAANSIEELEKETMDEEVVALVRKIMCAGMEYTASKRYGGWDDKAELRGFDHHNSTELSDEEEDLLRDLLNREEST